VEHDTARIAELNDLLRTTFLTGKVVLTQGVAALPDEVRFDVANAVREYSDFGEDNDPYGERDFGVCDVAVAGRIFWKIDYYAPGYEGGSEDPSDAGKTARMLTIMLAGEW
jgi:hypothetical protein